QRRQRASNGCASPITRVRAQSVSACKRNVGFAMVRNGALDARAASAWSSGDMGSRAAATKANQPLGRAEITHPFHPLRGQRFVVLKLRTISGVATLSVRHPDRGSFTIPG